MPAARSVATPPPAPSAAARTAPAVRYQRVFAYVACPAEDMASALELKEVSSGANVTLLSPYDAGVFAAGSAVRPRKMALCVSRDS